MPINTLNWNHTTQITPLKKKKGLLHNIQSITDVWTGEKLNCFRWILHEFFNPLSNQKSARWPGKKGVARKSPHGDVTQGFGSFLLDSITYVNSTSYYNINVNVGSAN